VRFRIEQRFPGPLEVVESAFLDADFLRHLGTLPKLGAPELLRRVDDPDGHVVHLWVRYQFTGDVSPAVRRVVDPQRLSWVEESSLDRRTHRTSWTIRPDNYGGLLRSSGTFQLEHDGDDGTRRVAEGELNVSVPLVGGKVANAIVSGLREHAALEEQAMADWLQSRS
jgi:hypothetical protein